MPDKALSRLRERGWVPPPPPPPRHPVTAHGFNLQELRRAAAAAGADPGDLVLLARYDHGHRRARAPRGIVGLFSDDRPPFRRLLAAMLAGGGPLARPATAGREPHEQGDDRPGTADRW